MRNAGAPKVITAAALGRKLGLMCGAGGLLLFVLGVPDIKALWSARELVHMSVAELELGNRPEGTWLEIAGGLSRHHATDYSKTPHQTFVPVVSSGWQGPAIAAVLKIPAGMEAPHAPFRGMVSAEAVPGPIHQVWVESGIDTSRAIVVELGAGPTSLWTHMAWMFGCGSALLACAVAVFVFKRGKSAV